MYGHSFLNDEIEKWYCHLFRRRSYIFVLNEMHFPLWYPFDIWVKVASIWRTLVGSCYIMMWLLKEFFSLSAFLANATQYLFVHSLTVNFLSCSFCLFSFALVIFLSIYVCVRIFHISTFCCLDYSFDVTTLLSLCFVDVIITTFIMKLENIYVKNKQIFFHCLTKRESERETEKFSRCTHECLKYCYCYWYDMWTNVLYACNIS